MTVSDLFRVSYERQWVKIKQTGHTIYDGLFEDVPENLLDCTIRTVEPAFNGYDEIFLIELNG